MPDIATAVAELRGDLPSSEDGLDERLRSIGADLDHDENERDRLVASLREAADAFDERLVRRQALIDAADARRAEERARRLATLDELAELLDQAHGVRDGIASVETEIGLIASVDALDAVRQRRAELQSRVDAVHDALARHGHAADETIVEAAQETVGVLREASTALERIQVAIVDAESRVRWLADAARLRIEASRMVDDVTTVDADRLHGLEAELAVLRARAEDIKPSEHIMDSLADLGQVLLSARSEYQARHVPSSPETIPFPISDAIKDDSTLPQPSAQPSDSMVEVALALSDELEEIDLSAATASHPHAALPDGAPDSQRDLC